jgi:hypothetical protein
MVPTVDRAKATVMTKVQFEAIDPRILPEMSAKVAFLSKEVTRDEQRPLVAVSPEAIATRAGSSAIFVVRDDIAVRVPVTPGVAVGGLVAIEGGAKGGERAIVKPPVDLADGASVRTATK